MKIKQLLGSLLAMATLTTCAFAAVGCSTDSAQSAHVGQTQTGGMAISGGASNGISLMATTIPADEYADYGVATTAESAQLLTATITPSNATISSISWSVDWNEPADSWATGKEATNYVSVTKQEDEVSASAACLKSFGSKIKITCTVIDENDNTWAANAVVDYVFKPTSLSAASIGEYPAYVDVSNAMGYNFFTSGWEYETNVTPSVTLKSDTTYTIGQDEFEISIQMTFTSAVKEAFKNAGFTVINALPVYGDMVVSESQIRYSGNLLLNALADTDAQAVINGTKQDAFFAVMREIADFDDIGSVELEIVYEPSALSQTYEFEISLTESDFVVAVESVTISDSQLYF